MHRSSPRRVANIAQLQALLEDLTDPVATIYEGDRNSEGHNSSEDTTVANIQHSGYFERGIKSTVMGEEVQLSPAISTGPRERPTHIVGHVGDSIVRRIGLSIEHRPTPSREVDTL